MSDKSNTLAAKDSLNEMSNKMSEPVDKCEDEKNTKKEDTKKSNRDAAGSRRNSNKEGQIKTPRGVEEKKKKKKEKNNIEEKINGVAAIEEKNEQSNKNIINEEELFMNNKECEKTNSTNNATNGLDKSCFTNSADDNAVHNYSNNFTDVPLEKDSKNNVEKESDVQKTSNVQKTNKISENAEIIIEPLIFQDKLNMWKGTINSIQIKKEDEKKQQEERLRQLENVKLAHNLKKEEELLQKEYLEQLKKDEELAKQVELELNEEVRNELNKIKESDYLLAQKLQNAHDMQYEKTVRRSSSSLKKTFSVCRNNSKKSNKNNISSFNTNDINNNDTSSDANKSNPVVNAPKSKTQKLKTKFCNLFTRKKNST